MQNLMDNLQFNPVSSQPQSQPQFNTNYIANPGASYDLRSVIQMARQNPQWLEQEVRRINPQGYQQALQIRNGASPMQVIMQMAKANKVHPSVFQMLGIK